MRIAMSGNLFPFGPTKYYGGERVIGYLIEELAKLGHEIVLFDVAQSAPVGVIEHVHTPPLYTWKRDMVCEAVRDYEAKSGKRFDVYHCNYFGEQWDRRTPDYWNYCELVWCAWCHIKVQGFREPFNTISYSRTLQRDMDAIKMPTTMIHYGIPMDRYQVGKPGGYLVWLGKIEEGKGVEWAIATAKKAKMPIVLLGPPYKPSYMKEKVLTEIDGSRVIWLRGVTDTVKAQVLSNATAFLSPTVNGWCEHFGIVNIEAMASGCPVVAWSRRSNPSASVVDSVVQNGVNGYVVHYDDSEADFDRCATEAAAVLVDSVSQLDREVVRRTVFEEYSSKTMARRYEWLYGQIQNGNRFASLKVPF